MCECLKAPSVIAGWGCCGCRTYNGLQRKSCRICQVQRCSPLLPNRDTKVSFETYAEAYADDPEKLAMIRTQMAGLPS